jgi:hypothetical protein
MYAELTFFEGAHFSHIAAYHDHLRHLRIQRDVREAFRGRR